jgi:hypothetical protein
MKNKKARRLPGFFIEVPFFLAARRRFGIN